MTVKTIINENELQDLLAKYNFGSLVRYQTITTGTVQTNYKVVTKKGNFVLRYYENRSKHAVMFEVRLLEYLKKKGFPCTRPFKNNNGNCIGIFQGKPYVFFEFVEGKHQEKIDEQLKKQLVKIVARLHKMTTDYESEYIKYRMNYSVELCQKLAKEQASKINSQNAWEKAVWVSNELSRLELPETLPKGICHCDFNYSNIIYNDLGKIKALIDFDDANYTFLLFDLCCLFEPFIDSFSWNTWDNFKLTDDILEFEGVKLVVSEYNKYRPLTDDERKYIFDVYKLTILMDCIWYFDRGNVKDFYEKRKINYLNKLGRKAFSQQIFSLGE